jgi:hypothetical protein
MGKLAKEFTDIINEQDFCFDPYEMQVIQLATNAINEWEEQHKGCYGCLHLEDKKYKCESCVRFGHDDYYVSNG